MSHFEVVVDMAAMLNRKRVVWLCGVLKVQLGHFVLVHCEFGEYVALALNDVALVD